MMMLKYRSHQSSSNLVLLWCAHSQQNGDKRTEQKELDREKESEGKRERDRTAKKNNHPNKKNEQRHATLIRVRTEEQQKQHHHHPNGYAHERNQKRRKKNNRDEMNRAEKKCWNENTNFQYIRTIYIAANEKSCIRKLALLLLLMFIEVQHLSASRWFPISLIHFQPTRSLSHSMSPSAVYIFPSASAIDTAATVVAFILHRNVLFALYPKFLFRRIEKLFGLFASYTTWQNALMMQQQLSFMMTASNSYSSHIRRNENTLWQI